MPLKFTDRAREALGSLLDEEGREPGQLIRMLSDIYGHFHLVFDERKETDQVVEFEGRPVLVIEASVSDHIVEHIRGDTLDIEMGEHGPSLQELPVEDESVDTRSDDPYSRHSRK